MTALKAHPLSHFFPLRRKARAVQVAELESSGHREGRLQFKQSICGRRGCSHFLQATGNAGGG
jgi:hypothetical protein